MGRRAAAIAAEDVYRARGKGATRLDPVQNLSGNDGIVVGNEFDDRRKIALRDQFQQTDRAPH